LGELTVPIRGLAQQGSSLECCKPNAQASWGTVRDGEPSVGEQATTDDMFAELQSVDFIEAGQENLTGGAS